MSIKLEERDLIWNKLPLPEILGTKSQFGSTSLQALMGRKKLAIIMSFLKVASRISWS